VTVLLPDSHHYEILFQQSGHIRDKLIFAQSPPLNVVSVEGDWLFPLRVVETDNLSFLRAVQKVDIFEESAVLLLQVLKFGGLRVELGYESPATRPIQKLVEF
jgi:hypothetical protein